MTWEIIPIDRFGDYASSWDTLQRSSYNVPFLESLFIQPLLDEFGTGRELLALATTNGQLRSAAILTKSRTGIWQTFQPSQLPLGTWISTVGADHEAHYRSLIQALPGFNIGLSITQQDPLLLTRPENSARLRTMDYIATAWIDIDRSFDTYWEARGKNLKTNTRKQRTKLASEGVETTLECISDAARIASAIDDYGLLETTGWKGKDGTAVHADNAQGRFYRKMLENFCAVDRARIFRYRFNDKTVAMDLCIVADQRIVILKTAYDETYKTVSPSTLMRQDEFRHLFDNEGLKRIEFYGKVMEWHTRWTENARTLYHITAYRWALLADFHARRQRHENYKHGDPQVRK